MPPMALPNAREGAPARAVQPNDDDGLLVPVRAEPRKPWLAWQGMGRREVATSVPTEIVEIENGQTLKFTS
jgi:hypothetical protein